MDWGTSGTLNSPSTSPDYSELEQGRCTVRETSTEHDDDRSTTSLGQTRFSLGIPDYLIGSDFEIDPIWVGRRPELGSRYASDSGVPEALGFSPAFAEAGRSFSGGTARWLLMSSSRIVK